LKTALTHIFNGKVPIIVCIGTDAVAGDSLGPIVGSMLKEKILGKTFIFGSLDSTVTAKDVTAVSRFLNSVYVDYPILAIDAALGKKEEIGNVKLSDQPVKPGLGVNKDLSLLGTASLIGVVEQKLGGQNLLSSVRVSLVYKMAEIISSAVSEYVRDCANNTYKSNPRNFSSSVS
jgi:putative sporulation protein YyaC